MLRSFQRTRKNYELGCLPSNRELFLAYIQSFLHWACSYPILSQTHAPKNVGYKNHMPHPVSRMSDPMQVQPHAHPTSVHILVSSATGHLLCPDMFCPTDGSPLLFCKSSGRLNFIYLVYTNQQLNNHFIFHPLLMFIVNSISWRHMHKRSCANNIPNSNSFNHTISIQ